MSPSGSPLRKVLGVIQPVAFQADGTSPLASTAVLEVTRYRRNWRVVAGPIGVGASECFGKVLHAVVESGSSTLTEVGPHEAPDAPELIPTGDRPTPVGFSSGLVFLGVWPLDASAHDAMELFQDIEVSDRDLKARLKPLCGVSRSRLVTRSDIALSLKKARAPRNLRLGRFVHVHSLNRDSRTGKTPVKVAKVIVKEETF